MPKTQRGIGTMRTHRRLAIILQRRSKIILGRFGEREIVKSIPISAELNPIVYKILQTQDIFSILFQPEFSECDFNIYEFKKYRDIREQVVERLEGLGFSDSLKQNIINNLDNNSRLIEKNIHNLGVPHVFD